MLLDKLYLIFVKLIDKMSKFIEQYTFILKLFNLLCLLLNHFKVIIMNDFLNCLKVLKNWIKQLKKLSMMKYFLIIFLVITGIMPVLLWFYIFFIFIQYFIKYFFILMDFFFDNMLFIYYKDNSFMMNLYKFIKIINKLYILIFYIMPNFINKMYMYFINKIKLIFSLNFYKYLFLKYILVKVDTFVYHILISLMWLVKKLIKFKDSIMNLDVDLLIEDMGKKYVIIKNYIFNNYMLMKKLFLLISKLFFLMKKWYMYNVYNVYMLWYVFFFKFFFSKWFWMYFWYLYLDMIILSLKMGFKYCLLMIYYQSKKLKYFCILKYYTMMFYFKMQKLYLPSKMWMWWQYTKWYMYKLYVYSTYYMFNMIYFSLNTFFSYFAIWVYHHVHLHYLKYKSLESYMLMWINCHTMFLYYYYLNHLDYINCKWYLKWLMYLGNYSYFLLMKYTLKAKMYCMFLLLKNYFIKSK